MSVFCSRSLSLLSAYDVQGIVLPNCWNPENLEKEISRTFVVCLYCHLVEFAQDYRG